MGSTPAGISASRGAAVLGLSPWATPVSVWTQIMEARTPGFCETHGIVPPEPVDNAAVRWGLAFEGEVIRLAEEARDAVITDRERAVAVPGDVPVTAHIDGLYHTGEIHEGKTAALYSYRDKWGEPGTDRIPRDYAVQVQHQQLAARACGACPGDRTILSVLVFPGRPDEWEAAGAVASDVDATAWASVISAMGHFHQYEIGANLELQARMFEIYRQWWADYVVRETPPPPDGYDDIRRLIPEPRGTVVADEQTARWCAEYGQINDELARIEKRKKQLAGMILAPLVGGAERPIDDDSTEALVLRDTTGRTRDRKMIPLWTKSFEGAGQKTVVRQLLTKLHVRTVEDLLEEGIDAPPVTVLDDRPGTSPADLERVLEAREDDRRDAVIPDDADTGNTADLPFGEERR